MMTRAPNIYGLPPGVDVGGAFVNGFLKATINLSPHERAQSVIFVNTSRMRKRLQDAFAASGAMLLPCIRLITDLANDDGAGDAVQSPLAMKLEIAKIIAGLLDAAPELAPRSSVFALADSLIELVNEMAAEEVTFDQIAELDVMDQSGHWKRTLEFLKIIAPYASTLATPDHRLSKAVAQQIGEWQNLPPKFPVFVVGSTGSRTPTRNLMRAVARLDNCGVILPGFDQHMPFNIWKSLSATDRQPDQEDHPQFRFWKLLLSLGIEPSDVRPWASQAVNHATQNELVSLALRPAPVTDGWREDGPNLGDLLACTSNISLLEAPTPKVEAEAIALRLMQAITDGQTAALISPNRVLTRQVAAALDRWKVVADDSAGVPLHLTPPGRLFGHVADLLVSDLTAELLLTTLKHPLTHTGAPRGNHLLWTRELELRLRKTGKVLVNREIIEEWTTEKDQGGKPVREWSDWLLSVFFVEDHEVQDAEELLNTHIALTERICAGPEGTESGELWDKAEGREAQKQCANLRANIGNAGPLSKRDYAALFSNVFSKETVRNPDTGRSDILILGTLESRVNTTDLVILGGLNEGIWPQSSNPDPWLNRQLRQNAGLLSPERQVGLSAHDFQQGMGARVVMISRSIRNDESETVPSRWVNRLTNLLEGLSETNGPEALRAMRARGQVWADCASAQLDQSSKIDAAHRPSPRPPTNHRPTQLSVTQIKTLIRDPYAIYAKKLLNLPELNTLAQKQEYQLKGILYHKILQLFIESKADVFNPSAEPTLISLGEKLIAGECPWPAIRVRWQTDFAKVTPLFIAAEQQRQSEAKNIGTETKGRLKLTNPEFTLTCEADRIDLAESGAIIYDYKTGEPPTKKQQMIFDKQLLLEAAMMELGAFSGIAAQSVQKAQFLGIKKDMKIVDAPLNEVSPAQVIEDFKALIENWRDQSRGYTARMAMLKKDAFSAYDHLSRFGEWGPSDDASSEDVA
ncbi:double-strand break repair protein AddB [Cognatiyoonia sp.]|uniref:double-strand break repair protein AddB n=1 Tax=Cognatiyoonia sp. TaxID=2211652 RepID=UPI003F69D833